MLRDISPKDKEYKLSDLVNDSYDIVKEKKKNVDTFQNMYDMFVVWALGDDDNDHVNNEVNYTEDEKIQQQKDKDEMIFRKGVYDEYIGDRLPALEAIKDGIRLNGTFVFNNS